MTLRAIGLGVMTTFMIDVAAVAAQGRPGPRADAVQKLIDCRAMTDNGARLACFDATVAALDVAEAKGEIVVVEKEQVKAVRRQAFGFTLPSLNIFDRDDKSERTEALERITAKLVRASRNGAGKWVMELEDGAVWIQTDSESLPRGAKAGSTVEIRKASMGSFFINVDRQRAIRASRAK